jgi:hypothetical protein
MTTGLCPITVSLVLVILFLSGSLHTQEITFERHVVDAEASQDPWAKMMGISTKMAGRPDVVVGGRDGFLV